MAQVATLTAGKPHRRVRWHKPPGKRPGVIGMTTAYLVAALERREGDLWQKVGRLAIVAGYARDRQLQRDRALRSDGAASLLAMLAAVLGAADVRSGFVGKPRREGGHWRRYTLADLCQLAYNSQDEATLRRGLRALNVMAHLGWLATAQVRQLRAEGFRSEPGVRHVNWNKLAGDCHTADQLKSDRIKADRAAGTDREYHPRNYGPKRFHTPTQRDAAIARRQAPPATGDPPERAKGVQAIADIIEQLTRR